MEYLLDHAVLPFLRQRFNLTGIIKSRALKVSGAGESQIDAQVGDLEKLKNPAVGLNAHSGVVVIRITATAASEEEADGLIAPVEHTVRERLGKLVFGSDTDTLEGVVLAELATRGETLAVVESGTGGRLAGKLALAEQGKDAFVGGKIVRLTQPADLIELARLASHQAQADWGLACVVEGDGGEIQLGIGLWNAQHREQWRRGFGGHPALAPEWSANVALDALRRTLAAAKHK
jgi:nicotinamide mononucleotide (NMN) deamidase PncC